MKDKCLHCDKPLVKIGTSRVNGTVRHDDWSGRKYHKKCWKDLHIQVDATRRMLELTGQIERT